MTSLLLRPINIAVNREMVYSLCTSALFLSSLALCILWYASRYNPEGQEIHAGQEFLGDNRTMLRSDGDW
jgi:hypothetical protein